MIVIVTGSRYHKDRAKVYARLDQLPPGVLIRVGDCPSGVDKFVDQWMDTRPPGTVILEQHKADWNKYGPSAGPRRNGEMVRAGADLCIAFPTGTKRDESKGTWDCVDQARRAGIPVEVIQ